jgi:hypothetical protein
MTAARVGAAGDHSDSRSRASRSEPAQRAARARCRGAAEGYARRISVSLAGISSFRVCLFGSTALPVPPETDPGAITSFAKVKFLTWTDDNLLRQVVYQGLREDKPASEVVRPVPYPKPAVADATAPRSRRRGG